MTMTDRAALSPENQTVLDELERVEARVIPAYGENPTQPVSPPEAETLIDGKVECPECGKPVKATYLQGHMLKQHHIGRQREFKSRKKGTNSKPKGTEVAIPTPPQPQSTEEPLTVDGIMTTLVELRWPHAVPTKKVAEMLEIRTALEKFLS